ncbi:gibberellin-regulated protein 9-like [Punica granatum]|uniref:Gibberellin-regulated protein 9-like n=1 Tax=Punica granatum TaxID=22663 RepID=A0A218W3Y3_PUNGR|nr:gibberellin-regulated protein 9-like [Punica granatum]OWM67475.1 hypothetical protein CDL15_Pgr028338 [Punica granatum]
MLSSHKPSPRQEENYSGYFSKFVVVSQVREKMQKKLFVILVLAVLSLQAFAEVSSVMNPPNSLGTIDGESQAIAIDRRSHPRKINCGHECSRRCKKSSRKNLCHRACKTCCRRCNCVLPGTYGNLSACPCYASLRTHGNRPKCP